MRSDDSIRWENTLMMMTMVVFLLLRSKPGVIKKISSRGSLFSINGEDSSQKVNSFLTQGTLNFRGQLIVCSHDLLVKLFVCCSSVREATT